MSLVENKVQTGSTKSKIGSLVEKKRVSTMRKCQQWSRKDYFRKKGKSNCTDKRFQ